MLGGLMRRLNMFIIFLWLPIGLAACSDHAGPLKATLMVFMEQEPGTEASRTRMLVTRDFMRIADGADDNNFLLFKRKNGTIYTSTEATSRIMVIEPKKVDRPAPFPLEHRVDRDQTKLPPVGGKQVLRYRLFTNDQLCYDLAAAEGLLPDALKAMKEYRQALAGEQAQSLDWTPKEMLSPCSIANNIFLPVRHLMHGFPVKIQEMSGRTLALVDYKKDIEVDPKLFELLDSYSRLELDEMRGM
jgi:hypothetical protein